MIGCTVQSLTAASPEVVEVKICSVTESSSENTYKPSGLGRALTKSITSWRLLTSRTGRIGPKISSCITGESGRRQSFRCGRHDQFGDGRAAGEKNVIPLLFQQRGGLGRRTEDDRKRAAVQIFRDEPRDQSGGGSGHFRGFYDSRVSRRNRPD